MAGGLVDGGTPRSPHFLLEMISDINGENDTITRGELLCILRMMERILGAVNFVSHMITPVCSQLPLTY